MKTLVMYLLLFVAIGALFVDCQKPDTHTDDTSESFTKSGASLLSTSNRFRDIVFTRSQIDTSLNIPFRTLSDYAPGDTQKVALSLDFYEPRRSIDTMSLRPLIIWMHGGGFEVNDKGDERETCMRFATRGYTVASINYRLNPMLSTKRLNGTITANELYVTIYRAIQDARFAIRFAKANAAGPRVDTNNIFFAGLSAGGVTALHIAYLKDGEIAATTISPAMLDSLGSLDYGGASFNASARVKGIMVFSGSILDINIIKQEDSIPAISLHSGIDNMLPIGCGDSIYHLLSTLCSGREVHKKLETMGFRTAFKYYDSGMIAPPFASGITHGGVVTPGNSNYLTESGVQFAVDMLSSFFNLH